MRPAILPRNGNSNQKSFDKGSSRAGRGREAINANHDRNTKTITVSAVLEVMPRFNESVALRDIDSEISEMNMYNFLKGIEKDRDPTAIAESSLKDALTRKNTRAFDELTFKSLDGYEAVDEDRYAFRLWVTEMPTQKSNDDSVVEIAIFGYTTGGVDIEHLPGGRIEILNPADVMFHINTMIVYKHDDQGIMRTYVVNLVHEDDSSVLDGANIKVAEIDDAFRTINVMVMAGNNDDDNVIFPSEVKAISAYNKTRYGSSTTLATQIKDWKYRSYNDDDIYNGTGGFSFPKRKVTKQDRFFSSVATESALRGPDLESLDFLYVTKAFGSTGMRNSFTGKDLLGSAHSDSIYDIVYDPIINDDSDEQVHAMEDILEREPNAFDNINRTDTHALDALSLYEDICAIMNRCQLNGKSFTIIASNNPNRDVVYEDGALTVSNNTNIDDRVLENELLWNFIPAVKKAVWDIMLSGVEWDYDEETVIVECMIFVHRRSFLIVERSDRNNGEEMTYIIPSMFDAKIGRNTCWIDGKREVHENVKAVMGRAYETISREQY